MPATLTSSTLHNTFTQLQFVQWQAQLALVLQATWSVRHLMHLKGDTLCLNSPSQPIMQAPCGVLAATNPVMYLGQNVPEGDLTRGKKTRKKTHKGQVI